MKSAEIEVSFQIWGSFSQKEIEDTLKLKADRFYITRAGNPIWEITTGLSSSEGIEIEISKIMSRFQKRQKNLITLKKSIPNIEYVVDIRINTYNQYYPALVLMNKALRWSGKIGADIGISIYDY